MKSLPSNNIRTIKNKKETYNSIEEINASPDLKLRYKDCMRLEKNFNKKNGSALLSTILVIAVLSVLAASIMLLTYNNFLQARVFRDYEKAFYNSEEMLRLGSEAINKAGIVELQKALEEGNLEFNQTFFESVIATAITLLPSDIVAASENEKGVMISLIDNEKGVIELVSTGEVNNQKRKSKLTVSLNISNQEESFKIFSDYGMIIGGDISFSRNYSASTSINPYTNAALGGRVLADKVKIKNTSNYLPEELIWWDSIQDNISDRFTGKPSGYTNVYDNIIEILPTGSHYNNNKVEIKKSNSYFSVGTKQLKNLSNMTLFVDGDVVFNSNINFEEGKFTNFMVFATGNIYIDVSEDRSHDIKDKIFLYSGGTVYFYDRKNGSTNNITIYANNFKYINSDSGSSKPSFYGQLIVKNNFDVEVKNGNITIDMFYQQSYVDIFYNRLNELVSSGEIEGVYSSGASYNDMFYVGKVVELR